MPSTKPRRSEPNGASKRAQRQQSKAIRSGSDSTGSSEMISNDGESIDLDNLPCAKEPRGGPEPMDLDEAWPYTFEPGDPVWILSSGGDWTRGIVAGSATRRTETRAGPGLSYPVRYAGGKRTYFAPLNGDIKHDTIRVRELLKEAGWI